MQTLVFVCVCFRLSSKVFATQETNENKSNSSLFTSKIVHLDMKGAPLNIPYMEKVFPLLRKLGATGLLIEYEDMFPYDGVLQNLTAKNHYSRHDINRLLNAAQINDLSVIPLVQTFGHLEFALKLPEHVLLRESFENPQVVCPSFHPSVVMVREMVRQVAELHKGHISHIHIGSDEVFVIGKCVRCQQRMSVHNWTTDDLFVSHVHSVASFAKHLGLQPIMWDDMFRKTNDVDAFTKLKSLTEIVELMVWTYGTVGPSINDAMTKYAAANFTGVWIASAFKGAAGPTNQLPQYELHLTNHIEWVAVVSKFKNNLNLKGIAITGWQRFDHFGALCELFPTAIPVLALCLKYLDTGSYNQQVLAEIQSVLNCSAPIPLNSTQHGPLMSCQYDGAKCFTAAQQFGQILEKRASIENSNNYKGWLSPMNVAHNFSARSYVSTQMGTLSDILELLSIVSNNINDLTTVTDDATLHEWLETFWKPQLEWAHRLQRQSLGLLAQNTWPRRPLYN